MTGEPPRTFLVPIRRFKALRAAGKVPDVDFEIRSARDTGGHFAEIRTGDPPGVEVQVGSREMPLKLVELADNPTAHVYFLQNSGRRGGERAAWVLVSRLRVRVWFEPGRPGYDKFAKEAAA